MPYATQADLLNQLSELELIQLTDDAGSGAIDAVKVTAAIERADSDIDSYARGRFTIPLQTSTKVKQLSVDLAIFYLEQRRRRIRETTQAAYDHAMAFLKDLSRGLASLDQPVGATAQASEADVLTPDRTEQEDKLRFDDDNLDGF